MTPLLLGLLGLVFHTASAEVRRFESLAASDIRSKLQGEAVQVSVKTELADWITGPLGNLERVTIRASDFSTSELPLFTEPQRGTRGKIGELRLVLDRFSLGQLRIEHLEASIPDCRFDYSLAVRHRQIRLSRSGVGTGLVRIQEKDLEAFILRKFREIKRVAVRIDRDKVFVDGYGEFIIVNTNFSVIASLVPSDGDKLVLANARIFLNGERADEPSRQVLLNALNPVVDLSRDLKLHGAIHVEGVRLRDGVLQAWGRTRIPERPASLGPISLVNPIGRM